MQLWGGKQVVREFDVFRTSRRLTGITSANGTSTPLPGYGDTTASTLATSVIARR